MKKLIKISLLVLFVLVVYLGLITVLPKSSQLLKPTDNDEEVVQLASVDDIEGWDIDASGVKQVEIHSGNVDVVLSQEEGNRLIHAFNAIQKEDIYWDQSLENAYEYGPIGIEITVVMNHDEEITINPTQDFRIGYQDEIYATRYHLDIYDEIRELQTKYGFQWTNNNMGEEMNLLDTKVLYGQEKDVVVDPELMIIQTSNGFNILKTLPFYGFKTFNNILETYDEIVLNDIIETNNYVIKVIEIVDGEITAISVSNK